MSKNSLDNSFFMSSSHNLTHQFKHNSDIFVVELVSTERPGSKRSCGRFLENQFLRQRRVRGGLELESARVELLLSAIIVVEGHQLTKLDGWSWTELLSGEHWQLQT